MSTLPTPHPLQLASDRLYTQAQKAARAFYEAADVVELLIESGSAAATIDLARRRRARAEFTLDVVESFWLRVAAALPDQPYDGDEPF